MYRIYYIYGLYMSRNRDKFVELAEKRVIRTLKYMRLIGNLANRSNYSYTEDDVKKILSVLETEMKNLKARFEKPQVEMKLDSSFEFSSQADQVLAHQ